MDFFYIFGYILIFKIIDEGDFRPCMTEVNHADE
jgi:hypothetical protein